MSHLTKNPRSLPIARIARPSFAQFHADYVKKGVPVVIRGAVEGWSALTKWNFDYLKKTVGSISVPVAKSHSGVFGQKDQITPEFGHQRFDAFIDAMMLPASVERERAEVVQVNLPKVLQPLARDVELPEYIDKVALHNVNIWIAPANVLTWLHYDPYHNLYACVLGKKKVTLIAPKYFRCVYPYPWHAPHSHFSQVQIENPDLTRFPRFRGVDRLETVLEPGEMLFIPIDWWHQVSGVDKSVFVNFFWHASLRQFLAYPQLHKARYLKGLVLSRLRQSLNAILRAN